MSIVRAYVTGLPLSSDSSSASSCACSSTRSASRFSSCARARPPAACATGCRPRTRRAPPAPRASTSAAPACATCRDRLAGRRVDRLERAPVGGRHPLAADQQLLRARRGSGGRRRRATSGGAVTVIELPPHGDITIFERLPVGVRLVRVGRVLELHVAADQRRRVEHAAAIIASTGSTCAITFACPVTHRQRLDPHDAHVHLAALGVDADHRDGPGLARHAGTPCRARPGWPTASTTTSAPRPSVAAFTAARGSSSVRCTASAPNERATASRSATVSTRDHLRGAARARRLHGAQPDGPEPQHDGGVAGLEAGRDDRVIAGAHHVAGEQRRVVRHPVRARAAA